MIVAASAAITSSGHWAHVGVGLLDQGLARIDLELVRYWGQAAHSAIPARLQHVAMNRPKLPKAILLLNKGVVQEAHSTETALTQPTFTGIPRHGAGTMARARG